MSEELFITPQGMVFKEEPSAKSTEELILEELREVHNVLREVLFRLEETERDRNARL